LQFVSDRPPAVRVEHLWVTFRTTRERNPTFRTAVSRLRHRARSKIVIDALRGVSFDVGHGEVYAVIGRNGAGKTTLLRTIAGILPPTDGRVSVWGRVTPLLSLGVGFNRDLTGRENILLGGLANGLDAADVHAHYDEVEEFAGLGDAIDYPMRTYSAGMFGRLGFAVAAHLNPEILLVDEALAAGDAEFKKKCMAKMVDLCERDCTVVIVSHGLEVVKQLAQRAVWLDRGIVMAEGGASDVVDAYLTDGDLASTDVAAMEDV
jgi:ABC-type polysaccharide/polyol phosphate transport system ATPase subunit